MKINLVLKLSLKKSPKSRLQERSFSMLLSYSFPYPKINFLFNLYMGFHVYHKLYENLKHFLFKSNLIVQIKIGNILVGVETGSIQDI